MQPAPRLLGRVPSSNGGGTDDGEGSSHNRGLYGLREEPGGSGHGPTPTMRPARGSGYFERLSVATPAELSHRGTRRAPQNLQVQPEAGAAASEDPAAWAQSAAAAPPSAFGRSLSNASGGGDSAHGSISASRRRGVLSVVLSGKPADPSSPGDWFNNPDAARRRPSVDEIDEGSTRRVDPRAPVAAASVASAGVIRVSSVPEMDDAEERDGTATASTTMQGLPPPAGSMERLEQLDADLFDAVRVSWRVRTSMRHCRSQRAQPALRQ